MICTVYYSFIDVGVVFVYTNNPTFEIIARGSAVVVPAYSLIAVH